MPKAKLPEDVKEPEATLIEETPNKKAKAKPRKIEKIAPEEIAEKLHILFGGLAKVLKYEYEYTPADYDQESRALARLNEKFPFLAQILILFDPILVALGLYFKFTSMKKKEVPRSEVKANAGAKVTTIWATPNIHRSNGERQNLPGQPDAGTV